MQRPRRRDRQPKEGAGPDLEGATCAVPPVISGLTDATIKRHQRGGVRPHPVATRTAPTLPMQPRGLPAIWRGKGCVVQGAARGPAARGVRPRRVAPIDAPDPAEGPERLAQGRLQEKAAAVEGARQQPGPAPLEAAERRLPTKAKGHKGPPLHAGAEADTRLEGEAAAPLLPLEHQVAARGRVREGDRRAAGGDGERAYEWHPTRWSKLGSMDPCNSSTPYPRLHPVGVFMQRAGALSTRRAP